MKMTKPTLPYTTIEQVLTPLLAPVLPTPFQSLSPAEHWMLDCVRLSLNGWGGVSPNPLVGAMVLDPQGKIIGTGWHAEAGKPHAEPVALESAGTIPHGSTLVVTLEPCNHWGKTPPCTRSIIQSGIQKVVVGCKDANPLVAGTGIEALLCAGIEVQTGVLEAVCQQVNRAFFTRIEQNRPFVALKWAQTLDGKLATRQGHSQWITAPPARTWVHGMRAGFDALLTSASTVAADNPAFTCRQSDILPVRPPVRVVLDTTLRLNPAHYQIFDTTLAPTWVIMGEGVSINKTHLENLKTKGVKVLSAALNSTGCGLDLTDVLRVLNEASMGKVWVEGGGKLTSAFLQADQLVDDVYAFISPKLLGDAAAIACFQQANIPWKLPIGGSFSLFNVTHIGEDALLVLHRTES
jgi:diaminohydroxyphosphoribosylaminopyrimidine deaminase/5-amino-6-(5-phosphoribosylamino)uracil reductase